MSFWLQGCHREWEDRVSKQVHRISWVNAVNPTDRHKSIRNLCVIKNIRGVFVLSLCLLWFRCCYSGFCLMTEWDPLPFLFPFLLRERLGTNGPLLNVLHQRWTYYKISIISDSGLIIYMFAQLDNFVIHVYVPYSDGDFPFDDGTSTYKL